MTDCIFCKIADGKIPADIVYQDDRVVAFRDLNPQAPLHVLVIPRQHFDTIADMAQADMALVGHMQWVGLEVARQAGVVEDGFRTVINCNADGGQSVYHLHMHVLGGRQMAWPPG
ncbi:histidine triad nucleotide-binding protein [Ectothiorhodospira lacustris]|uniref:histidine triad nucleotide-binding protein n=1 Tax=Ectothiorhodospira lacustris TaxID=2899127 RepID=UPI001EE966D0|nr:histidine triad nucleotide-binding protein [Ectothiorhodospira lacustris]MCG5509383.1 histidine triad nucleotide-binding protein [Ectothiorhodospira lacustris]MCG5521437.1 histidine triad nucleotide-binding protein [Ectothiorhodospira lacustris]